MPLPRYARFLTLVLAAIQFAAPALVSVADGAFAKLVRDPGMHLESTGDNTCTPPHVADCTSCRFLSGTGAGAAERPSEACPTEIVLASDTAGVESGAMISAATRSRAPPELA